MYISESEIKVRYVETDQMGVVHHSNYYHWFEVARADLVGYIGMTYKELEEHNILLPLIESMCRYKEGAKYADELIIKAWINKLTPVRVVFNYHVVREYDEKVLAEGKTEHVFVNKNFKPINMKKNFMEIWSKLENIS